MKNLILSLTRETIPYVKQLRAITKSVTGCVLMQQLDYWFARYPDGFYKFLAPPEQDHPNYKEGDSWQEEIGISVDEFRTAFDLIGVRYLSKNAFNKYENKFQDRYYCSYYDRASRLTYYFRNHELTDNVLQDLISGKRLEVEKSISRNGQRQSLEVEKSISRNGQRQSLEVEKSISRNGQRQSPSLYTEITSENKTKTTAESIYTACAEPIYSHTEISPEEIQPTQQTLIDVLDGEKETPIPPTPLASLPPENVGLAIATTEKPQKRKKNVTSEDLILFKEVWNRDAPAACRRVVGDLTIADEKALRRLIKQFGNRSIEVLQEGLAYARTQKWWNDKSKKLSIANYVSKDKPEDYARNYRDMVEEGVSIPLTVSPTDRPMTQSDIKNAETFVRLKERLNKELLTA
jgi:hypothetical protein